MKRRPIRADFEKEALPHLSALYGAALRMTRDPKDAEDSVQEALLRAYRFFDTFEAGTNCKAWLFSHPSRTCSAISTASASASTS